MEKREELGLKILKKLREVFDEEYSEAEGNLGEEKNCKLFFEGCLIASGVLYKQVTHKEIDIVKFTHMLNRLAVDLVVEDLKEEWEKNDV